MTWSSSSRIGGCRVTKEHSRELREYLAALSKDHYNPDYIIQCLTEALEAVEEGHTNGNMADISCSMYLFLKS